jgi:hypothetical protein
MKLKIMIRYISIMKMSSNFHLYTFYTVAGQHGVGPKWEFGQNQLSSGRYLDQVSGQVYVHGVYEVFKKKNMITCSQIT